MIDEDFFFIRTRKIKYNYEYLLLRDYVFDSNSVIFIGINFSGYIYSKLKEEKFLIDDNRNLYVKKNYLWDIPVFSFLQTKSIIKSSLFYDICRKLIIKDIISESMFKEVIREINFMLKEDKSNFISTFIFKLGIYFQRLRDGF